MDETEKQGIWDNFRFGWHSKKAGSRILFEVEASSLSVQYRKYAVHPAPKARLIIDGDEKNVIILDANFDETWGDKLHLQNVFFDEKRSRHTVEIVVTDEAAGKDFYLASLITA